MFYSCLLLYHQHTRDGEPASLRQTARKNDIVVTLEAPLGNIALIPDDRKYILSQRTVLLQTDSNRVINQYLLHLMTSRRFQDLLFVNATGSTATGIQRKKFEKLEVLLPPLPEQRAIAAALSDVDALLAKLDALIAKKRDLKQATMQQLLTGKQRLPGFSGRWEIRPLGSIASIDPDNLGNNTEASYQFRYISLEDVDRGTLRGFSEQTYSSAPSRARRKVSKDDILVSTVRPNLGSHLLFQLDQPDWICSTGFSVVRCKQQEAYPGYIFFHLFGDYISKQVETLLTGSNYPAINGNDVKSLKLPVPSLEEQRAIATVLSDMDAEIAALEAQRDKTRALKQGMMQELLTGRIRLL